MLPKIGPVRVRRLLEAFGDPAAVLGAPVDGLTRVDGIGAETARILHGWQDHTDPAKEIREAAERGIAIVTQNDEGYPAPLRDSYDPPLLLYVWGKIEPRDKHAIGSGGLAPRHSLRHACRQKVFLSTRAGRFHHRLGPGARHRHRGARGGDRRQRPHHRRGRLRARPALSAGKPRPCRKNRRRLRSRRFRVPPAHRAGQADVSHAQPHRRRLVARAARRGMPGMVRIAYHRESRQSNTAGRSLPCPGRSTNRPPPAATSSSATVRRSSPTPATSSTTSASCRSRVEAAETELAAEMPELPAEEAAVFAAVPDDESPVDRIIERCGLPAHVVSGTLMKLEMRRLVRAFPGFRYARR